MKVLVVSQYFWPENFKINDLCTELVLRGHEVTVLTGKPNYPEGEVFSSYKAAPLDYNVYQGCEVIRVPMITRGNNNPVKLLLNYISYFVSATIYGSWKLRGRIFDVIFVFEPSPVTVCLPAIFFKKLKKVPVVFWVLDLWPETLEAMGVVKSKSILKAIGKLVSFIYNRCDLVLGQSKAFYKGIARYCSDEQKIKYFPSWSENVFSNDLNTRYAQSDENEGIFKVLFAGNIGEAQDFPAILECIKLLKEKKAKIKLIVVGDGRAYAWLNTEVASENLGAYVELLGRHPLEAMPSFYASADALLVTLQESPVFEMTIPGKVQSYMASGKPILTMLSGEGSRVISEAQCGYTAKSGDYNQLAINMIFMSKLDKDMLMALGDKARNYALAEFSRDKLITQLEQWFYELYEANKIRSK